MAYDAFISYSHEADHRLAVALERALQRLAKPWHKRRALEIFRDGGNLNLSAHLWGSIQQALSESRFLIYLASPAAARSHWIAREIEYWTKHRDVEHLIVVLTDGSLMWAAERSGFDPPQSTALPEALMGAFSGEPFYLDMRWARDEAELSLANDRFRHQLVQIAATLKGVPVEDIEGEEAEQYRRMIRLRNAVITGLGALAIAALGFAGFAYVQRQAAVRSEQAARVQQERAERSAEAARTSARQAEERKILAEAAEQRATASEVIATDKAEEAARQRVIAENEAQAARVALATTSVQEAARLIGINQRDDALAHLARALRADPESTAARSWISHFMLHERWWWPAPIPHADVMKASLSPDGLRVVTASRDGSARVWDTSTGRPIGAPLQHKGIVNAAVFSADGRHIITASDDSTARVWEAGTGRPVTGPLTHQYQVKAAAFSADGRLALTSAGTVARLWDAATGQPVGVPIEHKQSIWKSALTTDGRYVGTSTLYGDFRVWEAASGRPLELSQLASAFSWAFNPDGRHVAAAIDGAVHIWDLETGRMVGDTLRHPDTVLEVGYSGDGRRIFTDCDDGMTRVWDVASGTLVGEPRRHSPSKAFALVMFSPEGHYAVSDTASSQVWNAATGQPVGPVMRVNSIQGMSMTPDGLRVVSVSAGIARVWRMWNPVMDPPMPMRPPSDGTVVAAAMTPDGRRIVTAHHGGTTRVWNGNTGEPVGSPIKFWDTATSVAISPDGRRIVTGQISDFEDDTRILDVASGQPVGAPLKIAASVTSVAFRAGGNLVVTASLDNTARAWDAGTAQPRGVVVRYRDSPNGDAYAAVLSGDGHYVLAVSSDGTARLWNTETGKPVGVSLPKQNGANVAAVSANARYLATASGDGVRVWDITAGQPLGVRLQHEGEVTSADFSPDGRLIVTASMNGTVQVSETATGRSMGAPFRHPGVFAATFTPDGRRVVTGSRDGIAHVWQLLLDVRSRGDAERLADLAEVVGGTRVTDLGSVVSLEEPERLQRVRHVAGSSASTFIALPQLLQSFAGSGQRSF